MSVAPPVFWAPDRAGFEELLRAAIARLPAPMLAMLVGAEVIVAELPGAEVVADGVDPRVCLLFDTADGMGRPPRERGKVQRLFFYQRNTERSVEELSELGDEIYLVLEEELVATFPDLQRYATQPSERDDTDADH